jgi:hypothetical protein
MDGRWTDEWMDGWVDNGAYVCTVIMWICIFHLTNIVGCKWECDIDVLLPIKEVRK